MSTETSQEKEALRRIFLGLQEQMIARLSADQNIMHPTTKGDATELTWVKMLRQHLPSRYRVEKAFVLDSNGCMSEQIDVVIFDQQYSPFLFNQDEAFYVPAESVYAIMEVKPRLNKQYVAYAGKKVASVRGLRRTSAPIVHAGGEFSPKEPFDIIGGILALESDWSPPLGSGFESAITELEPQERIDIGCALRSGSFEVRYAAEGDEISFERNDTDALIFFLLRLLARLQELGTAPALDIGEYMKAIKR